jgi:ATP-dependent RNA helicase RhlE
VAISFCNAEERAYLRDIQKLIRTEIPVVREHPCAIGSGKLSRSGQPVVPPVASPVVPIVRSSPPAPRSSADVIADGLRNAQRRRGHWIRRSR